MAYIPKVWVLMETVDPYDLQWGVTTESRIIGVFSTIENARDEFNNRRKDFENIEDDDTDCVYGDIKSEHILLEIKEHILDYVEI